MAVNSVIITLKAFQRFYLCLLPSQIQIICFSDSLIQLSRRTQAQLSEGEKVVYSNVNLSEKLQNIVDRCSLVPVNRGYMGVNFMSSNAITFFQY